MNTPFFKSYGSPFLFFFIFGEGQDFLTRTGAEFILSERDGAREARDVK